VIQLNILSGKLAGVSWSTRRFPVWVGRALDAELRLEEDGVWDQHMLLDLDREGFIIKVQPNALARINGQPASEAHLRNGDTIELGAVTLQFWLSGVCQTRLRWRQMLSWSVIVGVVLAQIAILYWFLK
jgi:hypothetical protein